MQAIETKYLGPTNNLGARITAKCNDNRVTISYPHELSGVDVHEAAARALCEKMGWKPEYIAGSTDNGYVFVFTDAYRAAHPDEFANAE